MAVIIAAFCFVSCLLNKDIRLVGIGHLVYCDTSKPSLARFDSPPLSGLSGASATCPRV